MNDLASTIVETGRLLDSLQEDTQSYLSPFPMGVFGTLRRGCGNHPLMGTDDRQSSYRRDYKYNTRFRAFLPHFIARSISIFFQQDGCCPFEVYTYDDENWKEMIRHVDRLEGFYPGKDSDRHNHNYGYNRTLAYLHILPDDFEHRLFPKDGRPDLGQYRDLAIPPDQWEQFPRLPCWVYSSGAENKSVQLEVKDGYPLIWYNTKRVLYRERVVQ